MAPDSWGCHMCKHEGIYIYIYHEKIRRSCQTRCISVAFTITRKHTRARRWRKGKWRGQARYKAGTKRWWRADNADRPGQGLDKARTRPQNCLGNKGRTQKDKPARPEAARRTRGGPRFTSARGQLQRSATGYAHRVYQFYCAAQLYNATVLHLSHNWYQECDMLHKGIVILWSRYLYMYHV